MTSDLPPEHRQSKSTTDQTDMLNGIRQSSQELSFAAIESERLAREERRRADSIQEQIRALLAQQGTAEHNSRRYAEQAEARQQAAREQSFFETQISKQAAFRHMISDEVFTRVAGGLSRTEDRDHLKAIAERKQGFDDPTEFKVLLWNAIAGNDGNFLANAAHKILERLNKKITDTDVSAIKSSVACLGLDAVESVETHIQTSQSPELALQPEPARNARVTTSPEQIDRSSTQAATIVEEERSHTTAINGVEEAHVRTQDAESVRSHSRDANEHAHNDLHDEYFVKEEPFDPGNARGHRRSIDDIDNDTEASLLSNASSTANLAESFLQDKEVKMLSICGRSVSPAIPSKRAREESVTSKRTSQPKPSKRPRTTKDPNLASGRIKSFVKHIEDMAKNDTLQTSDFMCVSCGSDIPKMKDPRVAHCLHLYDNKCLTKMRKGHGKRAKLTCVSSRCGKDVGTTGNKVTIEFLEKLKEEHLEDLRGQADEADEAKDEQLDEPEAETEGDDD